MLRLEDLGDQRYAPYKYMLTMRMNKAREYLELTDMTIHEIAIKTGFQDDASFSTRFSSMIGMSPLKYRKESITRKQVDRSRQNDR